MGHDLTYLQKLQTALTRFAVKGARFNRLRGSTPLDWSTRPDGLSRGAGLNGSFSV
jgi:hypothetical protein